MKNNRINMTKEHENTKRRRRNREKQLKRRIFASIVLIVITICSITTLLCKKTVSDNKEVPKNQVKAANIARESENATVEETSQKDEVSTEYKPDVHKPMIALTFDDGPGLRTMELLNVLEQYGVRATFFMCGNSLSRTDINVDRILKKMDAIGCETSNHTMEHKQLDTLSIKNIRYQVEGVNHIIRSHTGNGAAALRPPYGAGIHSKKVIENVGLPMIYWSIDTLDWKTKSKKATVKAVLKKAGDGDIVLMHDIHSWSVDAAIEIIPKLIQKGYQLVTVSEMAEARGIKLENGKTYFNFYP